jgi:hypothetical protein
MKEDQSQALAVCPEEFRSQGFFVPSSYEQSNQ